MWFPISQHEVSMFDSTLSPADSASLFTTGTEAAYVYWLLKGLGVPTGKWDKNVSHSIV